MESQTEAFQITGGRPLVGEVTISGAKNSALKLMAASLLAVGKSTITNVPDIADVHIMEELLTRLGCSTKYLVLRLSRLMFQSRLATELTMTWFGKCELRSMS